MAVKFRDYYEVLGVPRAATPDEIKQAYRKLARQQHPDLQPKEQRASAAERFKEINEAYEVLRDPEKRAKYDALGQNWKNGQDFTPPPGARTRGAGGESVQWEDFDGFSEFFSSIFGGAAPGGARRKSGGRVVFPGSDVEAEMPVSLEELMRGTRRRIQLGDRTLDVEVPLGTRDGTVMRLAGQGEQGMGGGPSGDLYLHIRMAPDPRFRTVGEDDLERDLTLWPWQAVLGAKVRVETPDGAVALQVPGDTVAGARLRLRGRGLPRRDSTRGDLYAVVRIAVPKSSTPAEREAYQALERAASAPADRPAEE